MIDGMTKAAVAAMLLSTAAAAAAPDMDRCRAIADSAARLACYDRLVGSGQSAAERAPGAVSRTPAASEEAAPLAQPRRRRAVAPIRQEEVAPAREGSIAAVIPLRHGYYRLELADGTAYNTTVVATPPPVGAAVRIRRTFLGTTFFDIKGWSPIAVKLSREQ